MYTYTNIPLNFKGSIRALDTVLKYRNLKKGESPRTRASLLLPNNSRWRYGWDSAPQTPSGVLPDFQGRGRKNEGWKAVHVWGWEHMGNLYFSLNFAVNPKLLYK